MYCKTCGKEINDNAVVCPYCGCPVNNGNSINYGEVQSEQSRKANVLSIVGFVLSLVSLLLSLFGAVAIVGLILSIVGLIQCNEKGERLKGLAIAGIVINIGSLCYTCYVLVLVQALLW